MSTTLTPWIGLAAVAGMTGMLLVSLAAVWHHTDLPRETLRKVFHLGGGAIALSLPWLFHRLWPVLLLGGVSALAFVMLRMVPKLKHGVGQVLHGVSRSSMGEFWFLLGVATVFAIASQDIVLYSISILILAVSDTTAALIGTAYGRHQFEVAGGLKSAEGSLGFLLSAFLCVYLPLLLFTDIGQLESALMAANVAILLTLAEAGATRGTDNFVVPVAVLVLLKVFLGMSAADLAVQLGVLVMLGSLVFVLRRHTGLSVDALFSALLVGYLSWSFGDWRWMITPVLLFAIYSLVIRPPRLDAAPPFGATVVMAVAVPGTALVTVRALFHSDVLYLPYVAAWGANLAVIGTLARQFEHPATPGWRAASLDVARALLVILPGVAVAPYCNPPWLIATLLTAPVALAMFAIMGRSGRFDPKRSAAWMRVPTAVSFGTLLCFGLSGLWLGRAG